MGSLLGHVQASGFHLVCRQRETTRGDWQICAYRTPDQKMSDDNLSLTNLLSRWKEGDRSVENSLIEEIYPIIRAQARSQIGRLAAGGVTMCATELAHEAFERLNDQKSVEWRNRNHFFAIAATVTRRVLVDYLRQRSAEKRGGNQVPVSLEDLQSCQIPETASSVDLLELDQVLNDLEKTDPELLRIVELRVFSGLKVDEMAEVCGISVATAGRRWRFARAWLSQHLGDAA